MIHFTWFFTLLFVFNLHASTTWRVNDDHSEVLFQVPYLGVSEVTGRFGQFSGELQLDDGNRVQELTVTIVASSIDTGHAQRDGHLRAQDFIFTKKHPNIIFESRSIEQRTPNQLIAKGHLTLRGISKPWAITIQLSDEQVDSWGYRSRFAKFKTLIKRSEFGIRWNKTLADNKYLVGDEVSVWGTFQLQPVSGSTPTSKHMIPDTESIRLRERLKRGEITRQEYDHRVGTTGVQTMPVMKVPERTERTVEAKPSIETKTYDIRQTLRWQIWFWVLGLLGFFAAIVLAMQGKKWMMDTFQHKYEEAGKWGNFSDIFTIGFTFLYAVAFWYVGWGK